MTHVSKDSAPPAAAMKAHEAYERRLRTFAELEAELIAAALGRVKADEDPSELVRALLETSEGRKYVAEAEALLGDKAPDPPTAPIGLGRLSALVRLGAVMQQAAISKVLTTAESDLARIRALDEQQPPSRSRAEAHLEIIQTRDPELRSPEGRQAYSDLLRAMAPPTVARSAFAQKLLDAELEPIAELLALDGDPRPMAKAADLLPGYQALAAALAEQALFGAKVEMLEAGHTDRMERTATLARRLRERVRKDAGIRTVEAMLRDELASAE